MDSIFGRPTTDRGASSFRRAVCWLLATFILLGFGGVSWSADDDNPSILERLKKKRIEEEQKSKIKSKADPDRVRVPTATASDPKDTPPPNDQEVARKLFLSGQYTACLEKAKEALKNDDSNEDWLMLLIQCQLTVGKYQDALAILAPALSRYPNSSSIRLRLLGCDVFRFNGQPEKAKDLLKEIDQLAGSRNWSYRDGINRVALGQAALELGADPKLVLERLFDPAKAANPDLREVHLALGNLALDKGDFRLASKVFQDALKKFPDDPDMLFGLARSFATSANNKSVQLLEGALEVNTNHVPSLLMMADHMVDAEEYGAAAEVLQLVLNVNPSQPEAWSYRAVLAHLRNAPEDEQKARKEALKYWPTNPGVDYLIGKKLSQKYRFREGSTRQRQALKFDPQYLPAKAQLAQDLLRLGEEREGWELVDEVYQADGYDVTAYNFETLKDTMAKFQTLTNDHFIVRMGTNEAPVYGTRVLALLEHARSNLCQKYGVTLEHPTTVEIFPEPKDFGVRTFGIPDNPGYLGVCFGDVVTANSPASQLEHAANWEAVLWHEFCHVVTLNLTKNKMPRWLSEGISVYEERVANPTWGQVMIPRYREMVLGDDFTPIGELSAAFLSPKSDLHLQFAYFESALVVEFLVEKFGMGKVKEILQDLANGTGINQAIAARTEQMERVEKDFAAFARARAQNMAPGLEWDKPDYTDDLKKGDPAAKLEWVAAHPRNFFAMTQQAKQLLAARKWDEAIIPLKKMIDLYPAYVGSDNAYQMLAETYHQMNRTADERETLNRFAALSADGLEAYQRLMDLGTNAKDWPAVVLNAERYLAVNPLRAQPYRQLARADEALNAPGPAIESYQTTLLLDPSDPAEVQYHLAKLLHDKGDPTAKRHVLQALEDAPRYREAHGLLLEIEKGNPAQPHRATGDLQ